jgi:hypothetical protein
MTLWKNRVYCVLVASFLITPLLFAATGLAQNPTWNFTAEMVNTQKLYPVSVEAFSTLDPPPEGSVLSGGVRSAEAGCLVNEIPCPARQSKTINCNYPAKDTDICSAFFRGGSTVTLRPVVTYGTVFAGWYTVWRQYRTVWDKENANSGTTSGGVQSWGKVHPVQTLGTYQFMVSSYPEENAVKAFFAPRGQGFFITLDLAGGPDAVGARVYSTPAGIDCWIEDDGTSAGACSAAFQVATTVRLNVTPGLYKKFLWWLSGGLFEDCEGTGACKILMIYPYNPTTSAPSLYE